MSDVNYKCYHESVVKDVVDVLTSLKDFDEVKFLQNSENIGSRRSFKSISTASKDLILTFPCMVSDNVSPNVAMSAVKSMEKRFASMLHMLFTAICVNNNEDVYDFVKKFHSNMNSFNGTAEDYAESLDRIADSMNESYKISGMVDLDVMDVVLRSLKESLAGYLPEDVKDGPSVDNATFITGTYGGKKVITEAPLPSGTVAKATADVYSAIKNAHEAHNKAFLNVEYKKANELMPTMLIVNFSKENTDGSSSVNTAIIGVKCKLVPIDSQDIYNRLTSKVSDRSVFFNLIRATTSDIAFFRDFIFAIDKAKIDAISYGVQGASNKMWKVLERRAIKSKFRRGLKMSNDATAITSLVLSENDVSYMKENYSIDIMNVSIARKLLDVYNFISIVIMNEALEIAYFLFDTGDDSYEKITFSGLEKESADSNYKQIINLLTKSGR